MQVDLHVTVNRDGSGVYEWKLLTSPYLQGYVQQAEAKYQNNNYEIKTIQENGSIGFVATKYVQNIAQQPLGSELGNNISLSSLLLNQMAANNDLPSLLAASSSTNFRNMLQIKPTFFTTTFLFHTNANLDKLANQSNPFAAYTQSLLKQLKMRFLLTLPIKPSESNADQVSADGKTLTWNMKPGKNNPIRVGVKLPTPLVLVVAAAKGQAKLIPHFGIFALGWILTLIALFILVIKLLRSIFRRRRPPGGGKPQTTEQTQFDENFKWD